MKYLVTLILCLALSTSAMAVEINDQVEVSRGPWSGRVGEVIAIYEVNDVTSYAVKFDESTYGLFSLDDIRELLDDSES